MTLNVAADVLRPRTAALGSTSVPVRRTEDDWFRRVPVAGGRPGEGPFTIRFADLRHCVLDRLAAENRRRRAGLRAHPLAQRDMRLGPDRGGKLSRGRWRRSRCAAKKWRSSPPGCRSCAVARLATPRGSAATGAPTPHPSDRSDMRRPPLDISDGAPPSTSLFAITVRPVTVKRPIRPDATRFWSGSKALKGGLTLTVQPLRSYLFRSVAAPIDVKLVDCCRLGDPTCDWSEVWAT